MVYKITRAFPTEEKYGLTSDIRRASNSVVHNIAEGYGRFERRDKTRFYKISRASAYEVISQLMVSEALRFVDATARDKLSKSYIKIIDELDRLIKSVENR